MAKIAYILLCHRNAEAVIEQAELLVSGGDFVSIHFDGRASDEEFEKIRAATEASHKIVLAERVQCGWGEWSLVQATLNALDVAYTAFSRATHFYLLSGDCTPIKPSKFIRQYLDDRNDDMIECHDFNSSGWIKTGITHERLDFRHWFNERNQTGLFYWSMDIQRRLGLRRQRPKDLSIRIGSQWFCLRRRTIKRILEKIEERPDIIKFFKTVWIPDETFFQTLVANVVPSHEIDCRTPTFLMFSDYGKPVTFYDDHYDLLKHQNALFARKVSENAKVLRSQMMSLYQEDSDQVALNDQGRNRFHFVTQAGRTGSRYQPRMWDSTASIGRDRELLIIICKKWHVGIGYAEAVANECKIPNAGYLFDDGNAKLPDLGGIESSSEKRNVHRRAVLRLLFESYKSNRLVICLDPSNLGALDDFYADICETRSLYVPCNFSDQFLMGHAQRTGLATSETTEQEYIQIVPTIRMDFTNQADAIRTRNLGNFTAIELSHDTVTKTKRIAGFLDTTTASAKRILTSVDKLEKSEEAR